MDRQTKTVKRHRFTFTEEELSDLGLESEKYDFMEDQARRSLKKDGYNSEGGEVHFRLGYHGENSTFTILI